MTGTVFLAAGGTGGHVFPAVAVAEQLEAAGLRPVFITDNRGYGIVRTAGAGAAIHRILAASPYSGSLGRRLKGLAELGLGLLQTVLLMGWYRPRAVVGFGGYPSVAPVLLGRLLGRATMLHEQNAFFGRANRFLARFAHTIALSWTDTANLPGAAGGRTLVTGMPVRGAFPVIGAAGYTAPGDGERFNLLVVGGSLGAAAFGDTVPEAVIRLPEALRGRLHVVHQARGEQIDGVRARYAAAGINATVLAFIDDMPGAMRDAHLVVCRAGASSVAELASSGRPAILVPFPGAMDDHQQANADTVVAAGGGWCIPEAGMSAETLAGRIASLAGNPAQLSRAAAAMLGLARNDAAQTICRRLQSAANGGGAS